MYNENDVFSALKNVIEPDLKRDLVTLNMIKNLKIDSNTITFDIELTTPACPLKDKMKSDCINEIKKVYTDAKVEINFIANTKSSNTTKQDLLPKVKNTIAVVSGKGGVGKSTVAVNIAIALSKLGAKVGLIDCDVYGPSIPIMFGFTSRPMVYENENKKMIPLEKYGIKLMSIGFFLDESNPVIWRGPMASGAVKQFISDVEWDELDYLVYDMPPGTGDIQLTLAQTIPLTGALVVTTPQAVSLADVRKSISMLKKVNVDILGVVENMSYFIAPDTGKSYDIFGEGGGKILAEENNCELLGKIPIDPRIRVGGDKGAPIVYEQPDIEHSKVFINIAEKLAQVISIKNYEKEQIPKLQIEL